MNRMKWLCSLACLTIFQGELLAAGKKCVISGKVNGLQQPTKVMVLRRVGEFGYDTVQVAKTKDNGEFSVTLPSSVLNEMYEMRFEGLRSGATVIAEKGNVSFIADKNSIYKADIKGTPENELYAAYQKVSSGIG